jgi:hypothetical protein
MEPLESLNADNMLERMPAAARADLSEWKPGADLRSEIAKVLGEELPLARALPAHPGIVITDDRPFNEYFLLRRLIPR